MPCRRLAPVTNAMPGDPRSRLKNGSPSLRAPVAVAVNQPTSRR
jgi:hypothetical protein